MLSTRAKLSVVVVDLSCPCSSRAQAGRWAPGRSQGPKEAGCKHDQVVIEIKRSWGIFGQLCSSLKITRDRCKSIQNDAGRPKIQENLCNMSTNVGNRPLGPLLTPTLAPLWAPVGPRRTAEVSVTPIFLLPPGKGTQSGKHVRLSGQLYASGSAFASEKRAL